MELPMADLTGRIPVVRGIPGHVRRGLLGALAQPKAAKPQPNRPGEAPRTPGDPQLPLDLLGASCSVERVGEIGGASCIGCFHLDTLT